MKKYIRLFRSFKESFNALLFAFLLSFFSVIGYFMNIEDAPLQNKYTYVCVGGGIVVILTFLMGELYLRLRDLLLMIVPKEKPESSSGDIKAYFCYLTVTMLMWLPVFLAYYPGLFAYDVGSQIVQRIGSYTTHHPLIHSLMLQFFWQVIGYKLTGNYNVGMACYTIFQMLLLAMAIAYMHLFLYRMKAGRKFRIVMIVFMGIFPVYSVLAISMTKDIIFAAFFLVLFLCLCYWEMMPDFFEKRHFNVLYVFAAIGTILFRNNGIYGLILLLIASLVFGGREKRKKFLFLSVASILISLPISGILKAATQASPGSINEMLSVPYQQLSYVYQTKQDELSPDAIKDIETMIPNVEYYRPNLADPVKRDGQAEANIGLFVSLWFRMFVKYPALYIDAFLHNTMGFWYLFDTTNAQIYGYGLEKRQGYLLTDTKPNLHVEHVSYFPALEELYENLFSANKYWDIPWLFILCSLALYVWIVILCTFYAVNQRSRQAILPVAFLLSYIITALMGPCALIRYVFPIISCIPPLFIIIFKPIKKYDTES